ncbi:lysine (k)-specific demethylase 2aa [Anaeramoeba flamelloides]|uniref:Lysine (K)-specific demethylase 2aa n=1 Tax=Anaeramoeba flamelloides TaxID=1746091 RepID=A0ABQ8YMF8_9EUKA|nr:lysine (k)-specific demethylase 2aa [Anaeramoeba flamelloides]
MSFFMKTMNSFKSLKETNNVIGETENFNKSRNNVSNKLTNLTKTLKLWAEAEEGTEVIKEILAFLTEKSEASIENSKLVSTQYIEFCKSMKTILVAYKKVETANKTQVKKEKEFRNSEKQLNNAKKKYETMSKKPNFQVKREELEKNIKTKKTIFLTKKKESKQAKKDGQVALQNFTNFKLKTIKEAYTQLIEAKLNYAQSQKKRFEESLEQLNDLPSVIEFEEEEESEEEEEEEESNDDDKEDDEEKEKEKEKKKKKKKSEDEDEKEKSDEEEEKEKSEKNEDEEKSEKEEKSEEEEKKEQSDEDSEETSGSESD